MRIKAIRVLTRFSLICLLMLPFAASAEARGHFGRRGGTVIVPGYSLYYPYWGLGWGWGWGGPFWDYGPYYYPAENTGKIKIKDHDKSDQVYINGAYAGTVDNLKDFRLDPGSYSVQIRDNGKVLLNRDIYVVTGKTVEIDVNRD
jgi:hypothetical protein